MSSRYVWGKYSVDYVMDTSEKAIHLGSWPDGSTVRLKQTSTQANVSADLSHKTSDGLYGAKVVNGSTVSFTAEPYANGAEVELSNYVDVGNGRVLYKRGNWEARGNQYYDDVNYSISGTAASVVKFQANKGDAAGSSSNASSAAYPPQNNREKISVICVIPPANERRVCNV